MNQYEYKEHYSRNLPHIQPPEATLFVTFRLEGSLPKSVIEQWRVEKKQLEMTLMRWAATSPPGTLPDPDVVAEEKLKHHRRWFKKFEEVLDNAQTGPLWLKETAVAGLVDEALRHRDGKVYRLDAFCVMPNHVHAVFAPYLTEELAAALAEKRIQARQAALKQVLPVDADEKTCRFVLASIMGALKGWTARRCNEILHRHEQFWQHESYDHIIRRPGEWERVVNYVINNPVKAGLVANAQDWPWIYRRQTESQQQQ